MKFIRTRIAIKPERNAAKLGIINEVFIGSELWIKVSNQAPKIVGKPRSKEKNIASVFFNFRYKAVLSVMPDLETPGNKASAWAKPINRDSLIVRSKTLLLPSSNLSAKYKIAPKKI